MTEFILFGQIWLNSDSVYCHTADRMHFHVQFTLENSNIWARDFCHKKFNEYMYIVYVYGQVNGLHL